MLEFLGQNLSPLHEQPWWPKVCHGEALSAEFLSCYGLLCDHVDCEEIRSEFQSAYDYIVEKHLASIRQFYFEPRNMKVFEVKIVSTEVAGPISGPLDAGCILCDRPVFRCVTNILEVAISG